MNKMFWSSVSTNLSLEPPVSCKVPKGAKRFLGGRSPVCYTHACTHMHTHTSLGIFKAFPRRFIHIHILPQITLNKRKNRRHMDLKCDRKPIKEPSPPYLPTPYPSPPPTQPHAWCTQSWTLCHRSLPPTIHLLLAGLPSMWLCIHHLHCHP